MKPHYSQAEFRLAKSRDLLFCVCYACGNTFPVRKALIKHELIHQRDRVKFCNQKCNNSYNNKPKKKTFSCKYCATYFQKTQAEVKKTSNHFCSRSCATSHRNKNKKFGCRRSKLEAWIEKQLIELYPNLEIQFNKKDAIGSELDIYIPSLKMAFEINGIFHYEPIFGRDKLNSIQKNDRQKIKACHAASITLHVINTSTQTSSTKAFQKYLTDISSTITNFQPALPVSGNHVEDVS